jgi:hypothetical protein
MNFFTVLILAGLVGGFAWMTILAFREWRGGLVAWFFCPFWPGVPPESSPRWRALRWSAFTWAAICFLTLILVHRVW